MHAGKLAGDLVVPIAIHREITVRPPASWLPPNPVNRAIDLPHDTPSSPTQDKVAFQPLPQHVIIPRLHIHGDINSANHSLPPGDETVELRELIRVRLLRGQPIAPPLLLAVEARSHLSPPSDSGVERLVSLAIAASTEENIGAIAIGKNLWVDLIRV